MDHHLFRLLRQSAKLTPTQLAKALGYRRDSVIKMEQGRHEISERTDKLLIDFLLKGGELVEKPSPEEEFRYNIICRHLKR